MVRVLAVLVGCSTLGLAGCGTSPSMDEVGSAPFAFAELRQMADAMDAAGPDGIAERRHAGWRELPRLAQAYRVELRRFEGIYGDGIGHAKKSPQFLQCKRSFWSVMDVMDSADERKSAPVKTDLWRRLVECKAAASRWSSPPETSTFAHDLAAMSDGSLLSLTYLAWLAGSPIGSREIARDRAAGLAGHSIPL